MLLLSGPVLEIAVALAVAVAPDTGEGGRGVTADLIALGQGRSAEVGQGKCNVTCVISEIKGKCITELLSEYSVMIFNNDYSSAFMELTTFFSGMFRT